MFASEGEGFIREFHTMISSLGTSCVSGTMKWLAQELYSIRRGNCFDIGRCTKEAQGNVVETLGNNLETITDPDDECVE